MTDAMRAAARREAEKAPPLTPDQKAALRVLLRK